MKGIVVCSMGRWCEVFANNKIYRCSLRGNLRLKDIKTTNPVAVGDKVVFSANEKELSGQISEILDRKNVIIRRATNLSKQTHILAANIDLSVLIATLEQPRTSTGFIDRFLISAEAYHIPVLVVFNKADLFEKDMEILNNYKNIYKKAGYSTQSVSAISGLNIDELKNQISGKTILLAGHSGVGKSALLNSIDPSFNAKVGTISKSFLKGKHTTTFAKMYMLGENTFIIDTPGVKEFGVVNFEPWELGYWFREFKPYILLCKYNNCTHNHEPDCAVREACEKGDIQKERYLNYLGILNNISEY